ncbi:MAG: helix-turn-helix domain-containing protein [Thermodesulfobacteriota bacterium]
MENFSNDTGEKKTPEDISLGSLFTKSREERHIEFDEIVKATRIRRLNLEAIENEEWSKLPSPVFVKGLLKSYAEFLGLDKETVLQLYNKITSFQKSTPEAPKKSRPPSGDRHYLVIIISLLVAALIVALMYLSKGNISIIEKAVQYFGTQSPVENKEDISAREDIEKKEGITKENSVKKDTIEQDDMEREPLLLKDEGVRDEMQETAGKSQTDGDTIMLKEPISPIERKEEKPLLPKLILTADVISLTWVSISIDDQPPKKYLLQPGQTPRWTANKDFNVLVGNAGGIDFFLDGKEVGEIGNEGQVVRIRFPEE